MAPIISIAEVARPAEEAFAYVIDPRTMPEWRQGVERGNLDTPTTTVGSHCTTVRKIRGREREVVTEITGIRATTTVGRSRNRRSDSRKCFRRSRTALE